MTTKKSADSKSRKGKENVGGGERKRSMKRARCRRSYGGRGKAKWKSSQKTVALYSGKEGGKSRSTCVKKKAEEGNH